MDDTTIAIIERITRSYPEPTVIPSGDKVTVFYDCVALTPSEHARLAAVALPAKGLEKFDLAVGLAYTGILFAAAIAHGKEVAILTPELNIVGPDVAGKRIVIVDDVVHEGKRMMQAKKMLTARGATVTAFCCIVDRSEKKLPFTELWSAYQTVFC